MSPNSGNNTGHLALWIGQPKTFCDRRQSSGQSDRRLRNRTLGFRVEEVSGKTATLRLEFFCDREVSRTPRRTALWSWHGGLSAPYQERASLTNFDRPPPTGLACQTRSARY